LRAVEDPVLRSCIAKAAKTEKVNRKSRVRRVDCSGSAKGLHSNNPIINDPGIKSLAGIEHFRGITWLKLNYNENIKDISPIANLPLKELSLRHSGIDDNALHIIAKLTKLQKLDLEYSFNVNNSQLVSLSLTNLRELRTLNLRAMGSKLADSKRFTQLDDGIVSDISFLTHMPQIHTLNLSGNNIQTGLEAFKHTPLMANLTLVNVVYSKNVNLSPLKAFNQNTLQNVFIQSNQTAPCDQVLDIIQHYAPDGKSAQSNASYEKGYFYLENTNTDSFIKISDMCLPKEASVSLIRADKDVSIPSSAIISISPATIFKQIDTSEDLSDWRSSQALSLSNNAKQGSNSVQFVGSSTLEFKKVFSTAIAYNEDASTATLQFWYFVDDASKRSEKNQVELGSGGKGDSNEYNWKLTDLVDGWNLVSLKINNANTIGTPDLTAINWFRMYSIKTGEITTRIDDIRIY
jgi:hypothetical protein